MAVMPPCRPLLGWAQQLEREALEPWSLEAFCGVFQASNCAFGAAAGTPPLAQPARCTFLLGANNSYEYRVLRTYGPYKEQTPREQQNP